MDQGTAELAREVEKLRAMLDAAPDALVIVDARGVIELVNAQTEVLFGYAREELIGRSVEMLLPESLRAAHVDHRRRYGEHPQVRPMGAGLDLRGRRRDGSEFPTEISLSPMRSGDERLVLVAARDISTRKQVERRLAASLAEKEILLKEVHHRVKNNLQVISSLLNLQGTRVADQRAREVLRESQTRVRSIALVHEKLYGSPGFGSLDFGEYLRALADVLGRTYGAAVKGVSLRILAEEVRLGMEAAMPCGLLVNELISNALKHAYPDGRGGAVVVTLRPDAATDEVCLEVADDGVGFPERVDFRKVGSLGMQLVCSLATQLRGTIALDRASGTRFAVRFPAGAASAA